MTVKEETIKKRKEDIWNFMKTGRPLTVGEVKAGKVPVDLAGKKVYHKLFEPMSGEVASKAMKRLREEGKVFERYRDDVGPKEYVPVTRLPQIIHVEAKKKARNLEDGLKTLFTKDGWVETKMREESGRYRPHHFSSYLGYCTLKRGERTDKRPSGWDIEVEDPWEKVEASKSTKKGDVELDMSIVNARFPDYDSEYDEFNLEGSFKRGKGEPERVSGADARHRYLRKIFRDWQEIAARTQTLSAFAKIISNKAQGDHERAKEIWYAAKRYPELPDKESAEVVEPMGKYLNNIKCSKKEKTQKKHEFLNYMLRRITQETEELRLSDQLF